MSNGHKLEIVQGDGQVFLNYWDWISGVNDTVFILRDGKAYKEDANGVEQEVDLAQELMLLSKRVQAQVELFYEGRDKP